MKRFARGFTLVELMVTVVIISVLAAIGYPAYTTHVTKSRRADAQQFMMQMDVRQKQILIEQRAYATAPNALNVSSTGFSCSATRCSNQYYDITFNPAVDNTATPPSYTICATPKSNQSSDGVLKLTSDGSKQRATGTTACTGGTANPW
jgi:type IV pilus assembly protein PilE